MGKLEYLDALKRALTGLPPELQAKTLAYYEQRFVDGMALGRADTDIARELDDPKKIAMTLRANAHLSSFEQKRSPYKLARLLVSALGLAIFNLFMVVPAIVYASLLATMYACALAFYVAGIAITASGLSGANELVLGGPLRHFISSDDDAGSSKAQTKVRIDEEGVHIFEENIAEPLPLPANRSGTAKETANETASETAADAGRDDAASAPVIKRAEAMAERGIRISTGMDAGARTTQTVIGLSMVVGAIILFLLSLVVTQYTIVGIKRYIDMNFSLLKGN
ncbi:DUF1700 domain-containing protein [Massilia psychrophila]|uniref:DUF1700 domain-containing protein n=1 Tax=Massilia psychrophila TaxID=1603353 RepID=A0A2G8SYJ9_9BURK|nr:DUF1700 domain-containing protein [Massilia psychrophila]PIL38831.1 hypothetical protein CR103_16020 [Massilia psychrophila]GGE89991.1 hypothetical protein GCM10008020_38850 [Massilia psychrophila]